MSPSKEYTVSLTTPKKGLSFGWNDEPTARLPSNAHQWQHLTGYERLREEHVEVTDSPALSITVIH